jgi:hypothetical protein
MKLQSRQQSTQIVLVCELTGCIPLLSGKTLSVRVMKDERGRSRGFGFVNYGNHMDAQKVGRLNTSCCVRVLRPIETGVQQVSVKKWRLQSVSCC